MTGKPKETEYAAYFSRYVSLVPEPDVKSVLDHQLEDLHRLVAAVPADREKFRYAEGKWSIREVIGHLIDAERVFGYRAFCISRGETASLPRFDENAYVERSHYDERSLADLLFEFETVRKANLAFFRHLDQPAWENLGTASNHPVSVRAIAFIMVGHVRHHGSVLQERYAVSSGT
jgi:hypothetical protein